MNAWLQLGCFWLSFPPPTGIPVFWWHRVSGNPWSNCPIYPRFLKDVQQKTIHKNPLPLAPPPKKKKRNNKKHRKKIRSETEAFLLWEIFLSKRPRHRKSTTSWRSWRIFFDKRQFSWLRRGGFLGWFDGIFGWWLVDLWLKMIKHVYVIYYVSKFLYFI